MAKLWYSCLGIILLITFFVVLSGNVVNAAGTIQISGANPELIHNPIYGQNYWCWDLYGDSIHGTEKQVRDLHLNLIRAGGYNNDAQSSYRFDPFTFSQVDEYVKYCRDSGVEPILQVPLLKNLKNKQATPQDAADLVTYCNITKKYNIKYWSIGNEPDLYAGKDKSAYTVNDFCRDFHKFSQAMKIADPTINIVGPELSWRFYPKIGDNDWLTPFLEQCKGDFDIVSVHRYPFPPEQCTIYNAMNDSKDFRTVIQKIRSKMNSLGLNDIPLAITEAHISWDGDPNHSKYPASPKTYYAGLWVADTLGVALEEKLWNISYWSLCEGWDIGFIDPISKKPRPSYYALQMFSVHFGSVILHPVSPLPVGLSVYASRNSDNDRTILIIINKNQLANQETITFSEFGKNLVPREYDFPGYSITCLSIPDNGGAMDVWKYTKNLADRGLPPEKSME